MKIIKTTIAVILLVTLQSMNTLKGVEGIWIYSAPDASYEYAEGEITIIKTGTKYTAKIVARYDSFKVEDVKVDKNLVVLKFYIEGTPITLSLTFSGDTFTGKSISNEGEISLTGKRKQHAANEE